LTRRMRTVAWILGAVGILSAFSAAALAGTQSSAAQPSVAVQQQAAPGSGKGLTIGYLSNKESVPIVHTISDSIRAQIKRSGATLVFCDGAGDNAKALDCAKTFKTRNVDGILNFQHDAKAAPRVCAAGPKAPVISIDIPQKPCEVAFMGVDNAYGGFVAGKLMGDYFKKHFNCQYDSWVSLEEPEIGAVNDLRMGGYQKGFASVCGPVKNVRKEGFDASAEEGRQVMADVLTALPGQHRIIVTSIDDEGIQGAFAAAKAAGREKDIWAGSLGVADKTTYCAVKTNPNWIAATAIFPEKYGWVGVPYLIKKIKGQSIPKKLYVPLIAVNSQTIGKYYKVSC
jgi:ribose transport system substrate-binding protein